MTLRGWPGHPIKTDFELANRRFHSRENGLPNSSSAEQSSERLHTRGDSATQTF
jgi:hypothetical protein